MRRAVAVWLGAVLVVGSGGVGVACAAQSQQPGSSVEVERNKAMVEDGGSTKAFHARISSDNTMIAHELTYSGFDSPVLQARFAQLCPRVFTTYTSAAPSRSTNSSRRPDPDSVGISGTTM